MKTDFPSVTIGEWNALRTQTASGLFAYRYLQSLDLLKYPGSSQADSSNIESQRMWESLINLRRPLTALVIFLNVVALEDFIRDFGIRLSEIENLENIFPNKTKLGLTPHTPKNNNKPSQQTQKDPVSLLDFEALNKLYSSVFGLNPIDSSNFSRLYDLAILRHCIAHNGAIVRTVDLPRFQFYNLTPNQIINPPVEFVKDTCKFLYDNGRHFEKEIQKTIFPKVISGLDPNWKTLKPKIIIDLIELFDYFGKIPKENLAIATSESEFESLNIQIKNELIEDCLKEL